MKEISGAFPYGHSVSHVGCGSDTMYILPLDSNFYWPPTLKGDTAHLLCSTSLDDSNVNVTRTCDEDGQWSEPDGLQGCYSANVNERFGEITTLLNQVSLYSVQGSPQLFQSSVVVIERSK